MIDTPYILDVVTGPVGQVLDIQEMASFGYVVEPDQFGILADCVEAASRLVEGETGRQMLTATYDVSWRRFPGCNGQLVLPRLPLSSVTSVKYYDSSGTLQTLSSTLYTVSDGADHAQTYIIPKRDEQWPTTYGHDRDVVVRFVCGYGSKESVPGPLKLQTAILAMGLFRERMPEACSASGGRESFAYRALSSHNTIQEFV